MTLREITNLVFLFLLYLILQILILRNVVLFDYAFCFVYIAGILLLPPQINRSAFLLISFFTGVTVDTFYNTLGMHAAATVLVAYVRPFILRTQVDVPGQEQRQLLSLNELGFTKFFRYTIVLALIHHATLFSIEASSITLFVPTLIRIVASTLFTTICIVLIQFFTRN